MTAFATHFGFEFKSALRNPTQLLMAYLFPLAFYLFLGAVMTQINPMFKESMVPAMIVLTSLTGTVLGLPGPAVQARQAGVYRSYKINGVPALSILAIPALTAAFHAVIASAIIAVTAGPLFGAPAPASWPAFALVMLAVVLTFGAIGALIGVVATNPQSTVLYSQIIFLPSMVLGGIMLPVSILPASIRPISALLPSMHAMQAFIGFAYGQATAIAPLVSTVVLLGGGLLAFGAAVYLFQWDSVNRARRAPAALALVALLPFVASIAAL